MTVTSSDRSNYDRSRSEVRRCSIDSVKLHKGWRSGTMDETQNTGGLGTNMETGVRILCETNNV